MITAERKRGSTPSEDRIWGSRGFPVEWLTSVSEALGWRSARLAAILAIDLSAEPSDLTKRLSHEESARLLRLVDLVTQVEEIVIRSGNPEGFSAARWVGHWLEVSCPALGSKRPADYLCSKDGFDTWSNYSRKWRLKPTLRVPPLLALLARTLDL